jgi:hypothetical protein
MEATRMTATNAKATRPGDVLEVETPKGFSYVQYVGKHSEYGDVIQVFGGLYKSRLADLMVLSTQPAYFAFYSARASVKRGLVRIAGSCPLSKEIPCIIRRAGARATTGKVLSWIIESDGKELMKRHLSETERQLPIGAVWDHALLVLRISEGWSPEKEG